jgi:hypothetical protein
MQSSEEILPPRRASSDRVVMKPAPHAAVPPHPLDKRWFAHVDGETFGPFSGHEIKQMIEKEQVVDSDFLCPEGGSAWVQAKNEPLLGALFRSRARSEPAPIAKIVEQWFK